MDKTIDMAREAGFNLEQGFLLRVTGIDEDLKRFEALVRADERGIVMNEPLTKENWQRFEDEIRADEREACAKTRAGKPRELKPVGLGTLLGEQQFCFDQGWREGAASVRAAIRARGNT
jgi:hypothetical protein